MSKIGILKNCGGVGSRHGGAGRITRRLHISIINYIMRATLS